MTYSTGGKIQASDINNLISTGTPNLNRLWGSGDGNHGYGQTQLPLVNFKAPNNKIGASTWNGIIATITKAAAHQGTNILQMTSTDGKAPTATQRTQFVNNIISNLSSVESARLNALHQGGEITSSLTNTAHWSNKLTFTITVSFGSHDMARYFFNAGGQLLLNSSHSDSNTSSINKLLNGLCSSMGTLYISSPTSGTARISGIDYHGIQKIGGNTGGRFSVCGVTNQSWGDTGFYNLKSTDTELMKWYSSSGFSSSGGTNYQNSTFGTINGKYNGSGLITLVLELDEVPNGATVTASTTVTAVAKLPLGTHLTNTWGTPVINITATPI